MTSSEQLPLMSQEVIIEELDSFINSVDWLVLQLSLAIEV
jgi:hypothetical protein